jgi:hypothetical protein
VDIRALREIAFLRSIQLLFGPGLARWLFLHVVSWSLLAAAALLGLAIIEGNDPTIIYSPEHSETLITFTFLFILVC